MTYQHKVDAVLALSDGLALDSGTDVGVLRDMLLAVLGSSAETYDEALRVARTVREKSTAECSACGRGLARCACEVCEYCSQRTLCTVMGSSAGCVIICYTCNEGSRGSKQGGV